MKRHSCSIQMVDPQLLNASVQGFELKRRGELKLIKVFQSEVRVPLTSSLRASVMLHSMRVKLPHHHFPSSLSQSRSDDSRCCNAHFSTAKSACMNCRVKAVYSLHLAKLALLSILCCWSQKHKCSAKSKLTDIKECKVASLGTTTK